MSKGIFESALSLPRERVSAKAPGTAFSMDSRLRGNDVGAARGTCLCTGTGTQSLAVSE
jgi:hypothetical protein